MSGAIRVAARRRRIAPFEVPRGDESGRRSGAEVFRWV
jgi:hypothetical protein